jgi:DNA repair exonuclease SbcCD ATPase subunit
MEDQILLPSLSSQTIKDNMEGQMLLSSLSSDSQNPLMLLSPIANMIHQRIAQKQAQYLLKDIETWHALLKVDMAHNELTDSHFNDLSPYLKKTYDHLKTALETSNQFTQDLKSMNLPSNMHDVIEILMERIAALELENTQCFKTIRIWQHQLANMLETLVQVQQLQKTTLMQNHELLEKIELYQQHFQLLFTDYSSLKTDNKSLQQHIIYQNKEIEELKAQLILEITSELPPIATMSCPSTNSHDDNSIIAQYHSLIEKTRQFECRLDLIMTHSSNAFQLPMTSTIQE